MMRPQHSQLRNHLRARHVDRGRGSGIIEVGFFGRFCANGAHKRCRPHAGTSKMPKNCRAKKSSARNVRNEAGYQMVEVRGKSLQN